MSISVSMPNIDPEKTNKPVHVAVGIVGDGHNRVLLARRANDVHQGGLWEFPGGKVQAGEDVYQALQRELNEELGIHVREARRLLCVQHAYRDKQVLLDIWQVVTFDGIAHGRESQPLEWVSCDELSNYDFPQANIPIVRALQWPLLYLITHIRHYGELQFMRKLEQALQSGARLIQFREPQLQELEFKRMATRVCELAHGYRAKVLINADPQWVADCNADGVHLNSRRLLSLTYRPLDEDLLVAASCHNQEELDKAANLGLDFVVLSPVRETSTHPQGNPLGWPGFKQLRQTAALPVYALGGLGPDDISTALKVGAHGVAMISAIWSASSITKALNTIMHRSRL